MQLILKALFIGIVVFALISCFRTDNEAIEDLHSYKNHAVGSSSNKVFKPYLEFFGVRLSGAYDEIMLQMFKTSFLSPIKMSESIHDYPDGSKLVSHVVNFCGERCSMQMIFRPKEYAPDEISIERLIFITPSKEDVLHNITKAITNYYGDHEPYNERWWSCYSSMTEVYITPCYFLDGGEFLIYFQ